MPTNNIVTYQRRMLNIQRLAGTPKIRSYNLAEHSYFVATLFLEFAAREDMHVGMNSIKKVLNHDIVETITADLPYMAKNYSAATKNAWATIEQQLSTYHGRLRDFTDDALGSDLTAKEYALFKTVDLLELWIFCVEEHALGNISTSLHSVTKKCYELIYENGEFESVKKFMDSFTPFDEIEQTEEN